MMDKCSSPVSPVICTFRLSHVGIPPGFLPASVQVALKPGHSLMDWIRFSKSGKDLTGLRGRLIEVSQEELRKHNKRDDCWTCIRGGPVRVCLLVCVFPALICRCSSELLLKQTAQ